MIIYQPESCVYFIIEYTLANKSSAFRRQCHIKNLLGSQIEHEILIRDLFNGNNAKIAHNQKKLSTRHVFMCIQMYRKAIKTSESIAKIVTVSIASILLISCGGGGSEQAADPLAPDIALAYVKRPVPVDDNNNIINEDILDPDAFSINGAALFLRDRASTSAQEINVTDSAFAAGEIYDVKDVEVSFDGTKLLFSMRGPLDPNAQDEDQPKWNIWEYDSSNNTLEQVIADTVRADQDHDISPAYLPDGRIIFTSTRQVRSRAILLDENISGFAATTDDEDIFSLHIHDPNNDPNGTNIEQITFNQGHDLQPTVLSDGRIAFLRSDNNEGRNNLSIYTINTDGSNLRILYGYHSQRTGNDSNALTTFIDMREQSDGTLSAILQARDSGQLGGDIIQIDSNGFTDINQATNDNSGASGPAQSTLTRRPVDPANDLSVHGHFNSAYPLADGSGGFLVSWSLCRQLDADDNIIACDQNDDGVIDDPNLAASTPPSFGLWTYDTAAGTQAVVVAAEPGQMFTDAVVMESRALPPLSVADPTTFDSTRESEGLAVLNIRSVYDTDGTDTTTGGISVIADPAQTTAAERPARFLRLIKAVSIPSDDVLDFDNSAFGVNAGRGMKQILGYAPIEPDGSVQTEIPGEVAFYFDVVNADGERISPLHRNWIHAKPGEVYQCKGCHTAASELPHGRDGSVNSSGQLVTSTEADSANPGAAQTGLPFPNTEPALFANAGETMAEVYARINNPRRLSTGLIYTDDWTDPTVRAKDADSSLVYRGDLNAAGLTSPAPTTTGCMDNWGPSCRIIINYQDHIQPLWEVTRPSGVDNNQCIACHSRTDSVGNLQTPGGQLELTNGPSADEPLHYVSYRDLFDQGGLPFLVDPNGAQLPIYTFNIVDGVQQFYLDAGGAQILDVNGNPIPEIRLAVAGDGNLRVQSFTANVGDVYLDAGANPILDANNNPIIFTVPVAAEDLPNGAVMATSNAAGSRFFDKLNGVNLPDVVNPVDHTGFMSVNELRLLREWLDIGGQYYNNPFDAPLN
jgi:hypothetical protein